MATKDITIHGEKFTVTAPYAEGHTLSAIEAKVLNQVRAENVANNFRKSIGAALEKPEAERAGALEAVRNEFTKYEGEYTFAAGGSTRAPVDPIEREAQAIAKASIKESIREKFGKSVKEYLEVEGNQEKYDAAVDKVAAQDDVLKLAKKRVADRKKSVANTEDIGL